MSTFPALRAAVDAAIANEHCTNPQEALIALGLRALLAAIGTEPGYRPTFIAKGGTVLRLLSGQDLGRLSTDLDFSGLDLAAPTNMDHQLFAAALGRRATEVLHQAYPGDPANVRVAFTADDRGARHDQSDPDTITYRIYMEAQLSSSQRQKTTVNNKRFSIDLTCDEYIDQSLIRDLVVTSYGIPIDVRAYAPLQSISEKMRAILQKRRQIQYKIEDGKIGPGPQDGTQDGNWVPRHLLDLAVLRSLVTDADLRLLPDLFRRKCAGRLIEIMPETRAWLLDERLLIRAREESLGDQARADRAWSVLHELIAAADIP